MQQPCPQPVKELTNYAHWVTWKVEQRDGKPTKIPYNPRTKGKADSTLPSTWSDYDTAFRRSGDYDGIGFVFGGDAPYAGVDLDHCIDEAGAVAEWAQAIVEELDSYTEYSPSGTGLHIFVKGKLPKTGRKRGDIEMYDAGRYFTFTGKPYGQPRPIRDANKELNALHARVFTKRDAPTQQPRSVAPLDMSDAELMERILRSKRGMEFGRLYAGDKTGFSSASDADMSLCNRLIWWTNHDIPRADRMFRASGLFREKWDSKRGDSTYGAITLANADAYVEGGYDPNAPEELQEWGEELPPLADTQAAAAYVEEHGNILPKKEDPVAQAWAEAVKDSYMYTSGGQWWEYRRGQWRMVDEEYIHRAIREFALPVFGAGLLPKHIANIAKMAALLLLHDLKELDANPYLIPLGNGVFDLNSDRMIPHSPSNMLTRQLPYDYDPNARCPQWDVFLDQVLLNRDGLPCVEWLDVMQEWFGYCLLPDAKAQTAMVWVGEGANGKGVASKVLEAFVGKDSTTAVSVDRLFDPYHRADLYGKMLGLSNELDPQALRKNSDWFKAIVGGDPISARHPAGRVFRFDSTLRLVISTNDLPQSNDMSYGYFRRLLIIEWRYTVPEKKRVDDLPERLMEELPGIFNWALVGLRRFLANGRKFSRAGESEHVLKEYRKAQDVVSQFVDACCVRGDGLEAWNDELYMAFAGYCQKVGIRPIPNEVAFGKGLTKLGVSTAEGRWFINRTRKFRSGIGLVSGDPQERETDL